MPSVPPTSHLLNVSAQPLWKFLKLETNPLDWSALASSGSSSQASRLSRAVGRERMKEGCDTVRAFPNENQSVSSFKWSGDYKSKIYIGRFSVPLLHVQWMLFLTAIYWECWFQSDLRFGWLYTRMSWTSERFLEPPTSLMRWKIFDQVFTVRFIAAAADMINFTALTKTS